MLEKTAQEEAPHLNEEPVPDFQQVLSNPELLSALDLALLELEKRLFRYAKVGPELLEMADEGLVLAARAKARLGQSLSAAQHTEGHLQVVGWANGDPPARAPRGTPSLASPILRTPSSAPARLQNAPALFTRVRGRRILRTTSPFGPSRKLRQGL